MMFGSGDSFGEMLMNSKGVCSNCMKELTFGDAAQLARKHGISDNVVMRKGCNHVFEVNLVPGSMTLTRDVTSRYPQIKPSMQGGLFSKLFGK